MPCGRTPPDARTARHEQVLSATSWSLRSSPGTPGPAGALHEKAGPTSRNTMTVRSADASPCRAPTACTHRHRLRRPLRPKRPAPEAQQGAGRDEPSMMVALLLSRGIPSSPRAQRRWNTTPLGERALRRATVAAVSRIGRRPSTTGTRGYSAAQMSRPRTLALRAVPRRPSPGIYGVRLYLFTNRTASSWDCRRADGGHLPRAHRGWHRWGSPDSVARKSGARLLRGARARRAHVRARLPHPPVRGGLRRRTPGTARRPGR